MQLGSRLLTQVVGSQLTQFVMPATIAVIVALFLVQAKGTASVARRPAPCTAPRRNTAPAGQLFVAGGPSVPRPSNSTLPPVAVTNPGAVGTPTTTEPVVVVAPVPREFTAATVKV